MTAERQTFQARAAALSEVIAFIEGRGRALGLPRQCTLKLLLVAEELFINSVSHGYGGDCGGTIIMMVRDLGADVEVVVEDHAPAFDPFAQLPPAPPVTDPNQRPLGGLGRVLVAGVSSHHSYERRGPVNRVRVCVPKGPAAAENKPPKTL